MDLDPDDRVRLPIRLVVAIGAGFLFWYVSTYIIPLTDAIVRLKEAQARDKAEHEALRERIDATDRRIERLEDRISRGH